MAGEAGRERAEVQADLIAKRKVGETWQTSISARAGGSARSAALLARFAQLIAEGTSDGEAAYRTLAEADLLWRLDEPSFTEPVIPAED